MIWSLQIHVLQFSFINSVKAAPSKVIPSSLFCSDFVTAVQELSGGIKALRLEAWIPLWESLTYELSPRVLKKLASVCVFKEELGEIGCGFGKDSLRRWEMMQI